MKYILAAAVALAPLSPVFANPFDAFKGDYSVTKQECTVNGNADTSGCDRTEVKIVNDAAGTLRLYELFPNGSVGYGLVESSYQSESGTIKETITGGDQNADWTHIEHIRQYAGSETSDVYEGRSVYKRNGGLYYSFYHHEKAPMMNEFTIVRNYTLEKK